DGLGTIRYNFDLNGRGQRSFQLWERSLDLIDGLDHVGARLTLNLDQHRPMRTHPAGEGLVLSRDYGTADIVYADRRAIAVRQDKVVEPVGGRKMIVCQQCECMLTAVKCASWLVDRAVCKSCTHGLEIQALCSELCRVDL